MLVHTCHPLNTWCVCVCVCESEREKERERESERERERERGMCVTESTERDRGKLLLF